MPNFYTIIVNVTEKEEIEKLPKSNKNLISVFGKIDGWS